MIRNPETTIHQLKKGDCFMYNREPYIVRSTYWENLGMIKIKIFVMRMKFDSHDWHTRDNLKVYRISRGLYDLLVK